MPTLADDLPSFTGTVKELEVETTGAGSAQLQFIVTPLKGQGDAQAFVVQSDASPQAFAAMASMLTAAYADKLIAIVTYAPGDPRKATNIRFSSSSGTAPARMGFV